MPRRKSKNKLQSKLKKQFSYYVLKALNEVQKANQQGYLLYPSEYNQKNAVTDSNRAKMNYYGATTHEKYFQQYSSNKKDCNNKLPCFRLKPNQSASEAMTALLTSGETIVDCGSSILVTNIYAILLAYQDHFGVDIGNKKFDALFGTKDIELPVHQRLLISNNGFLGGSENYYKDAAGEIIPLNPLSFIFNYTAIARIFAAAANILEDASLLAEIKNLQIPNIAVGSLITVVGHKAYYSKHPFKEDSNYNAVVKSNSKEGKLELLVFGHHNKIYTEQELINKLVKEYNKPGKLSDQWPNKISAKDINGLELMSNQYIKEGFLEKLLFTPEELLLQEYTEYLNKQILLRNQAGIEIYDEKSVEDFSKIPSLLIEYVVVQGQNWGPYFDKFRYGEEVTNIPQDVLGLKNRYK